MPDLDLILNREPDGSFKLYGCRGAGKGCDRNHYRKTKKPCGDCVPADDETETVAAFKARMERGSA